MAKLWHLPDELLIEIWRMTMGGCYTTVSSWEFDGKLGLKAWGPRFAHVIKAATLWQASISFPDNGANPFGKDIIHCRDISFDMILDNGLQTSFFSSLKAIPFARGAVFELRIWIGEDISLATANRACRAMSAWNIASFDLYAGEQASEALFMPVHRFLDAFPVNELILTHIKLTEPLSGPYPSLKILDIASTTGFEVTDGNWRKAFPNLETLYGTGDASEQPLVPRLPSSLRALDNAMHTSRPKVPPLLQMTGLNRLLDLRILSLVMKITASTADGWQDLIQRLPKHLTSLKLRPTFKPATLSLPFLAFCAGRLEQDDWLPELETFSAQVASGKKLARGPATEEATARVCKACGARGLDASFMAEWVA